MATNRLNGSGSLNYMGVNAPQPPNLIQMNRRPTVTDGVGFALGTLWLIPQQATGIKPNKEIWILVGNRQGIFTWKHLRGSTGPTPEPFAIKTFVNGAPGSYTYTPTDGMLQVTIECVGGGGGSAGWGAAGAGSTPYLNGGSGAAYSKKLFTASQIGSSQSYTVGAGGLAGGHASSGVPNPGGNGGNSTFGSFMTAGGGFGATGDVAFTGLPENSGGTATGGDINLSGRGCGALQGLDNGGMPTVISGGNGGDSGMSFGFGGNAPLLANGAVNAVAGTGYGSGGGGIIIASTNNQNGVAGQGGVVIITEYF